MAVAATLAPATGDGTTSADDDEEDDEDDDGEDGMPCSTATANMLRKCGLTCTAALRLENHVVTVDAKDMPDDQTSSGAGAQADAVPVVFHERSSRKIMSCRRHHRRADRVKNNKQLCVHHRDLTFLASAIYTIEKRAS